MYKKLKERAQKSFTHFGQDFDAFLVQNDAHFFIFDWKDRNGSGNLATRYILDKQRGTLIITGDSGDCIATWFNQLEPKQLAGYMNSESYFVEKIQCSTNKYTYHWEDVRADVEAFFKSQDFSDLTDDQRGELEDDVERIKDLAFEHAGGNWPDEYEKLGEKYAGQYWWETDFNNFGQRYSARIFQWIYGYQEGLKRLKM